MELTDKAVQAFLGRFPQGSPEREYHEMLLRVLLPVAFVRDMVFGFALLRLLQIADFVVGKVDTSRHPAAGSLYENAVLLAFVFSEVSDDPAWWVARYQTSGANDFDQAALAFWVRVFERSEEVTDMTI